MGALWGIFPTKEERSFSFINDPRASFFGMVIVLLLIFIGGSFIYINSRKTASVVHYGNSLRFSTQNNQASMIASFTRANQLWKTDFYNRILANQILTQMSSIQLDKTTQQGVLSQEVQKVLSAALSYADTATKLDTKNYRNWITLGDVYKFFVYLKMEGAAEKAQEAYTQARLLSPNNTTIDISIADLELLLGNTSSANKIITDSITKFPTVNAYFWLYQQNQKANQIDEAESNLLKAVQLQPNNVQLINFFGKFMFNYKKYDKAISLFERSLTLNKLQPDIFAFLGVSYESLGKTEEAKQIFEFLKRELPDTAQKMIDQIHVQQGITPAVETFNIQDDSNNSQIIEESALSTQ